MLRRIKEKYRRFSKGYKSGGVEYILYMVSSYVPPWFFFYAHQTLVTIHRPEIKAREYDGYRVRAATTDDIESLAELGVFSRDKIRRRLDLGHACTVVVKDGRIVSTGWAATGRIFVKLGGSIIDMGDEAVFVDGLYTIPAERMKGLFASVLKAEYEHFVPQGRNRIYGVIDSINKNSMTSHLRMGFEPAGETRYLILAGVSLCYYKYWPQKMPKLHVFVGRPPDNLEWV